MVGPVSFLLQVSSSSLGDRSFSLRGLNWGSIVRGGSLARTRLKQRMLNLTGVSPLAGFWENGFVAGQAVLKAESKKVEKHAKACEDNQHAFVPLAFDTFGSLAPEAVRFLSRIQRVVHINFSTPQGRGFVFSRLGFSIQKEIGITAHFVARLFAILM
ncbi:hypothetical protein HanIR_Chr04g0184751 [Helianthus annuus]|nr:hypothetical protein HanIR_Chr04g0184751 [Helianthus annuus]